MRADGSMRPEHIRELRRWPYSADFARQCDTFGLNPFHQNFTENAFHDLLDVSAELGGHCKATSERSHAVIDAMAAAGQELAAGGLTPATQQRVYDTYAAYAAAAQIYDPNRISERDALIDRHIASLGPRTGV